MSLNEFVSLFGKEFFEVDFEYRGRNFHLGCYYTKKLFKKGYIEYWFYEHDIPDSFIKIRTLDELLDTKVCGVKLKNSINDFKILIMY